MCVNMNVNGYSYSTYLIPTTEMKDAKFNAHLRNAIYVPELVFDTSWLGSETRQECIGEGCCSSDTTLQRRCHGLKRLEAFKRECRVTLVGDIILGFKRVSYLFLVCKAGYCGVISAQ